MSEIETRKETFRISNRCEQRGPFYDNFVNTITVQIKEIR